MTILWFPAEKRTKRAFFYHIQISFRIYNFLSFAHKSSFSIVLFSRFAYVCGHYLPAKQMLMNFKQVFG